MTEVRCKRCSTEFETAARLGGRTSCPSCRAPVYVPKAPVHYGIEYVLLLDCGHLSIHCGEQVRQVSSDEVTDLLWTCEECGAPDRTVLALIAVLPTEELLGADQAAEARLELAAHMALAHPARFGEPLTTLQ